MTLKFVHWRFFAGSRIMSARGFLVRALVLSLVFLVCHLAGFRAYTSILCGTYPSAEWAASIQALLGLLYVIVYLAFTVLVPVLLIAATLLFAWDCLGVKRKLFRSGKGRSGPPQVSRKPETGLPSVAASGNLHP